MKYLFTQSCGIFRNDILVAVGCNYDDILKYAEKYGTKRFVIGIKKNEDNIKELIDRKGFAILNKDLAYAAILYLEDFKDNWERLDTLLHELHHLVFMVARQKNFEDEMEAQAYLFEDLFRNIRHQLNWELKQIKKHKKNKKKS